MSRAIQMFDNASNLIRLHYFSEFVPVELENTRGRGRANIPILGQISEKKACMHLRRPSKTESPQQLIAEFGKLWDEKIGSAPIVDTGITRNWMATGSQSNGCTPNCRLWPWECLRGGRVLVVIGQSRQRCTLIHRYERSLTTWTQCHRSGGCL